MNVETRPARPSDRPAIERLIQLYLHDMTAFNPFPIGEDGLYAYDLLDRFWRHPFLLYCDGELAGFALVIDECPVTGATPCWFMAEFFVLTPYRRRGFASACCRSLIAEHKGRWHIGVIGKNGVAASFWRAFLASCPTTQSRLPFDGEDWLVYAFES